MLPLLARKEEEEEEENSLEEAEEAGNVAAGTELGRAVFLLCGMAVVVLGSGRTGTRRGGDPPPPPPPPPLPLKASPGSFSGEVARPPEADAVGRGGCPPL